jgi:ribosomal protein L34
MKLRIRKSSRKAERRGFRYRKKTAGGRKVIRRRRARGRKI